jgi:predicted O-methyltransferase YrrM
VRRLGAGARRRVRRNLGIRRLRLRGDAASAALAGALRRTDSGNHGPTELEWFRRIEERREALARSEEVIEVRLGEYGAEPADHVVRRLVGEVCRTDSKPPRWGRFLFSLVVGFRPLRALELGAGLGISAAYEAAGLELAGAGRLVSLEGAEQRVALARGTLEALGLGRRAEVRHGSFAEALEPALAELAQIDYAFVDGHHDEHATLAYWRTIRPSLARPAIVLFDDIRWSEGMARAWAALSRDPVVDLAVDLGTVGACLVGTGNREAPIRAPVD